MRYLVRLLIFATVMIAFPTSGRAEGRVYKAAIKPNWFQENQRFWYRNDLQNGQREFVLVDAVKGRRALAFDHERLAQALVKAGAGDASAHRLPIDELEFESEHHALTFRAGDQRWRCDLETYALKSADNPETVAQPEDGDGAKEKQRQADEKKPAPAPTEPEKWTHPDQWKHSVKDHNVILQSKDGDQKVQLSTDGMESNRYEKVEWARDGRMLVAFRSSPGERKQAHLIESSPVGGGRAKLSSRPYALPGDKYPCYELNLFDPETKKQIKPEIGIIDYQQPSIRWCEDGRRFLLSKVDRGHQRVRLIEVDTHTGETRNIFDEQTDTFIWTTHSGGLPVGRPRWLNKTKEAIYASERDGWCHLYLVDLEKGGIKKQITKGKYVVRGIDRIDEELRQIWFRASAKNRRQDPYLIHFYRVNFDGSGLVALTDGNGNHTVQYSPDRKYIIDTYSRIDMAPVHELRRVSNGKKICDLETADIAELEKDGWEPPEVFKAKGRDGKTDIWGIICRPRDFDPKKEYPIVEYIYAGPQSSFVPKTFKASRLFTPLTDLGFIVVQIDGMGTANRSKAFHDVCWHNLKDGGFLDRIPWIKAAAKKYPYMDATRVGIYGNSAGGQNAAAAVLFHPEFYKAAFASCGCHDNRMDKVWWNEQWMGYPVGPHYAESSNIDNAHRLKGRLMLLVGELDKNVPPESTMRLSAALIKAGKDFDLIVMPGGGHGPGGEYGARRRNNFFMKHLQGIEPPNRNAE
ncbi:MAG: prolyl oligopeptidase family serine peptidase [Kiritimatiellae bacterium]|nr:prolyl oligopeptidase family serine peptidase [Kiritimatiellia bacterium]